jgi:Cupin superfamily protein
MATVSNPRGQTFEEARLTFEDVQAALEKGTVIFNSAGAHIPKLAGPSLACTDATCLPNALNVYVTAPQKRTSAPPHTDKQDVVVVQTSGKKHWRVYSPPDPSQKPLADMFARGKGDDNLPLYALESEFGCDLLLETTLDEGDVLFIPAAFPHTTDTANEGLDQTSIHLTFGLDTHIWGLDYLSARRWALKRCKVPDTKLGQNDEKDNHYVGAVNQLPRDVLLDLMDALPMGFLDDGAGEDEVNRVCSELERISKAVDESVHSKVSGHVWKETTERLQRHGKELLDIHRDMYLAAVDEGRNRDAENAMMAHIQDANRKGLTPEQMQRLSVFRVKRFFDKIEVSSKSLFEWSYAGTASEAVAGEKSVLPENWAFTMPVKVGDVVDADLGGAYFPATVTRASGNTYDVLFFDGDRDEGLDRSMIKLLNPPVVTEEVDTSTMTPKQLKRWKKEQEKMSS